MRKRLLIGIAISVVTAAGTLALATSPHPTIASKLERFLGAAPSDPGAWPNCTDSLRMLEPAAGPSFGTFRVFVDPGHGAEGNTGNVSSLCQDEQDFTFALAEELAGYLKRTGRYEVLASRPGKAVVSYPARVKRADAWGADVFISLHSDVRGKSTPWSPEPGKTCPNSDDAPGFSVLWSDEREDADQRLRLARSFARSMTKAGFPAYDGAEYRDLYELDPETPGVFVDRHAPGKRIYVLRKPSMPSVIVETHNAWDAREAQRWAEGRTREVFFALVDAALVDFLRSAEGSE